MEAKTCLTAITRFSGRSGKPATILSDNGTNFVGAAKEKSVCKHAWNHSNIEKSLAEKVIKWNFNPPGAPPFGGIWERLVRNCKKAMMALIDGQSLTDNVFITTTCLVEQTLNARPMTSVSDDPDDLEALSLDHSLSERDNLATPFLPDTHCYTYLRRVFGVSQAFLVWVLDENLIRSNYKSARFLEVHEGSNGS